MEYPESRSFKIPDLKKYIKEMRKELVVSALTILRAYHVANRPHQDIPNWGGFDHWSRTVREPLVWLGMDDPCKTRANVVEDDPDRQDALVVFRALRDCFIHPVQQLLSHEDCATTW
jgi:putative DNA primase/helicase